MREPSETLARRGLGGSMLGGGDPGGRAGRILHVAGGAGPGFARSSWVGGTRSGQTQSPGALLLPNGMASAPGPCPSRQASLLSMRQKVSFLCQVLPLSSASFGVDLLRCLGGLVFLLGRCLQVQLMNKTSDNPSSLDGSALTKEPIDSQLPHT